MSGSPRSLAEMTFIAGLAACPACGDHGPIRWRAGGEGATWTLEGTCPRCATRRQVVFACSADPIDAVHADLELGGPEPSAILDPYTLMSEIDRLVPAILIRTTGLAEPHWSTNWERLERLRTALNELAKFLPEGADDLPITSGSGDVADRRQRPERYTRAWIEAEQAHWKMIAAELAEDFARVAAADPILSRTTPPRGRLDPIALRDHAAWLARGRVGDGRLDVVTTDARATDLEGANLAGCRLEGGLFARANLDLARLDFADLIDVDFTQASLEGASFVRARLRGVGFEHARLQSSSWNGAVVTAVSLREALLVEATLDKATFSDCDLRRCSLQGASIAGAVFERCDLRGAIFTGANLAHVAFVGCKFAGALGLPRRTDGWTVIEADFSDAGDGRDLGDAEDLLSELGS